MSSSRTIHTSAPADVAEALEHAAPVKDFLPFPGQLIPKTEKEAAIMAITALIEHLVGTSL